MYKTIENFAPTNHNDIYIAQTPERRIKNVAQQNIYSSMHYLGIFIKQYLNVKKRVQKVRKTIFFT